MNEVTRLRAKHLDYGGWEIKTSDTMVVMGRMEMVWINGIAT